MNQLITIPAGGPPPTAFGLLKAGLALAIGRGVAATRQIMGRQAAAEALAATALRQRDGLQLTVEALRAELAELRPVAGLTAPAPSKRPRWSAAESAALAELLAARPARRPGYAAIASELAERFGRTFTAKAVGAKARRMRA